VDKVPQSFRDHVRIVYMHKVDELEAVFLEEGEEEEEAEGDEGP
jgi:hypothetical protein